MRSALKLLHCLALSFAVYARGQNTPPVQIDNAPQPSDRFPSNWYPPDDNVTYPVMIKKNMPYTATLVTTYLRELDGKVTPQSTRTLQARDSAGRMREEAITGGHTTMQGVEIIDKSITIIDPVAHCTFHWSEPASPPDTGSIGASPPGAEDLVALVDCLPITIQYVNQDVYGDAFASLIVSERKEEHHEFWSSVEEPLGRRTFGDVQALGTRTTVSNTNPDTGEIYKPVNEIWYSPDIKEIVELLDKEPVVGTRTLHDNQIPDIELRDIKRTEPPLSLFYPPQGCVIVKGHPK